ncbi:MULTISPECIES: ATP-binding protein [Cupriavidus]
MRRLWPQTLSGRLALILVAGMMLSQLVTGTVWFDARYGRVAELPVRIGGARIGDIARLLEITPAGQRPALMARLAAPDVTIGPVPAPTPEAEPGAPRFSDTIFEQVLRHRLGAAAELHAYPVTLHDDDGEPAGLLALLRASFPTADLAADVRLTDGNWFRIAVTAGQAGQDLQPGAAFADYFVRIYLLRILVVAGIAVLAVRIAVRPLEKLSEAAERLGRNINSPPLAPEGSREVRRAASTFNLMQQRLIDGIRERTRFLVAISHDLRSPITRMRLRTESIRDGALRERFRADLEEMEAMIASTLDFVRGIEVEENRQQIDLDTLVRAVAEDAAEAGGEVRVTGHATRLLHGYPRSLRRCLQNLVENAVRYGGPTTVILRELAEGIQIVVQDNGPGIPPELLGRVFEPYFRVEASRARATGGTGLGLAIAQTIAAAHEGKIVLENVAAGGLRATLFLPLHPLP